LRPLPASASGSRLQRFDGRGAPAALQVAGVRIFVLLTRDLRVHNHAPLFEAASVASQVDSLSSSALVALAWGPGHPRCHRGPAREATPWQRQRVHAVSPSDEGRFPGHTRGHEAECDTRHAGRCDFAPLRLDGLKDAALRPSGRNAESETRVDYRRPLGTRDARCCVLQYGQK
jgi:hypothetical protein